MSLNVLDLFAGAGGFGIGFQKAGYQLLASLEKDKWACESLRFNQPNHLIIEADIRSFKDIGQIKAIISEKPDVIIGGPPCQGFSVAGPAQKDPNDPRNSLFIDFAFWIEALKPTVILMENVKGLLSRKNSEGDYVVKIIENTFIELGYNIETWLLSAAEYGVPQQRERVFVVGTLLDEPIGPPPTSHVPNKNTPTARQAPLFEDKNLCWTPTLWDAISDLPELEAGEGKEIQQYDSPPLNQYQELAREKSDLLFNHVAMNHSKRLVERFKHVTLGMSTAEVPEEHLPRTRNGLGKISSSVYGQNNRRLDPHKPSHTIAASFYANFIHPYQHRNLTAREGARIQSFPDHYRFIGKRTVVSHKLLEREGRYSEKHLCQYNQIGNAVPPLLAEKIARHIKRRVFE